MHRAYALMLMSIIKTSMSDIEMRESVKMAMDEEEMEGTRCKAKRKAYSSLQGRLIQEEGTRDMCTKM